MDDLMSRVLITKYPHVFLSEPVVDVAVGHFSVAERAIEALQELHPGLRISAISRDAVALCIRRTSSTKSSRWSLTQRHGRRGRAKRTAFLDGEWKDRQGL